MRYECAYRTHYTDVLGFAIRRVRNHDDAQDIAVSTYLTAWRQYRRLPDEPHIRSWLLQIARRHVSNFWRSQRRSMSLIVAVSAAMSLDDTDTTSPRELWSGLSQVSLEEGMKGLRSKDREVLRLIYWNDYTHAAVASAMGCSVNAVSLRVSRARDSLRKRLRANETRSVDAPMLGPLEAHAEARAQFHAAPSTQRSCQAQ